MDHNLWYQPAGIMVTLAGTSYSMAEFARYQQEWGLEPDSLVGQPGLVDAAGPDFRLRPGSLGVDAGEDLGIVRDFLGSPVPQGAAPDMGAYELVPPR